MEKRFRDFVEWLRSLPNYEACSVAKALYLEVDRGTGAQFLAADTNPNYTDSFPLPATPAKWRYRAIFQRDDEMIGQWSAWAEINMGS